MTSELIHGVLQGKVGSIARAISWVEERRAGSPELLDALHPHTGQAHLVGVTGAPGTGKSALINQLARAYRERDAKVGIVAIDPSSPFSGGALLGDRIRMRDLAGDPGVFVRSMATRGKLGGLADATLGAVAILDAAGFDVVFVETVGAGQDEIDVARATHTTIVVEAPGLGDDIQAIKAGLMEIADIFVVNKADREGADRTAQVLEMSRHSSLLEVRPARSDVEAWQTPICKTNALDGSGIPDVISAIEAHQSYLLEYGELEQKEWVRAQTGLEAALTHELVSRFMSRLAPGEWQEAISRVAARAIGSHEAIECLLGRLCPDIAAEE